MDGILNVYKPEGKTSHDIVNIMRRLLGMRHIGHTGTLDPLAEGVLPICIGKGCRAAEFLTAGDKVYRAGVRLGISTDTQDICGKVIKKRPVSVTEQDICSVLAEFVGESEQIPPMYSAIKVDGKKLYELARRGVSVERAARRVEIYSIEPQDIDAAAGTFCMTVSCSKGTYIRTLCHDVGERLGCGGAMESLVRIKSGSFEVSDSLTLEEISALAESGTLESRLTPVDEVFRHYDKITVDADNSRRVLNGISPRLPSAEIDKTYRVYGADGAFLCISRTAEDDAGRRILKMVKSFYG